MTPENFAYWLQGFIELNPNSIPSLDQWNLIKEHLSLVFNKKTNFLGYTYSPVIENTEHHSSMNDFIFASTGEQVLKSPVPIHLITC